MSSRPPLLLVILSSGTEQPLRAQEALDLVYAGLALDWRVSLLLRGAALRWLQPDAADPEAGPGARALPVLTDYGLQRLCVAEAEFQAAGLVEAALLTPVERLDATALAALQRDADHCLQG